jgi:HEAT repeat protein/beta-lactamase regulating signal transducer with metallopeptidase domain
MNVPLDIAAIVRGVDPVWTVALDALIKVTLVFAIAGVATLALARASAASRHLVWTLALVSALLIPVLSVALPRWQLAIVKVAAPPAVAPEPGVPVAHAAPPMRRAIVPPPLPESAGTNASPSSSSIAAEPAARGYVLPSAPMLLALLWAIGAIAIVSRLVVGLVAVRWMWRRTSRVVDAPWLPLAVELARDLGLTRRLTFLESRSATMPMACGILRPAVLMPADATRWPLERLRVVLLHELAHVRRRDCLTHVITQLACAIHWFNPLAWIAARHIRTERERACDDLVLAAGTRGSDYAEELLEIARVMRAGRFPALLTGATLAMAHRSQLEGRLIAILDPKVPRSGVSRLRTAIAAAAVACALPPLAALQPWGVVEATAIAPAASNFDAVVPMSTVPSASSSVDVSGPQPNPQPQPAPVPTPTPVPTPSISAAELGPMIAQGLRESTVVDPQVIADAIAQGLAESKAEIEAQKTQEPKPGKVEQEQRRGSADPRMIAALTAALKDSDKEVRETAMQALVRLRDPSIFEPLVQALKDPSPDVREQAAHGLGQMRDRRAVEPLIGALKDENPSVREQSAFALGQLHDPRAVDALIAALKDPNPDVREQAAFALGQIRDKRAAAGLVGAVKDENGDVREQAVFALGQLRDPSAVEGLTAALRDANADVRQQAAFALGQIRDPRAVAPLISALKDANAEVRQQAAFGLGQIRDRGAVEALVVAIKDPDPEVRQQVAFALGQIGDPRAIEALTNALKDTSKDVRQQAAFALGQLAR